jgi:hypothetical protein
MADQEQELRDIAGDIVEDVVASIGREEVIESARSLGHKDLTKDEIDTILDTIHHVELTIQYDGRR